MGFINQLITGGHNLVGPKNTPRIPEVPGYPAMLSSSIGCILAIATIAVFLRVRRAFDLVEEEEATPKLRRSSKAAPWKGHGQSQVFPKIYPLVMTNIAIENDHL